MKENNDLLKLVQSPVYLIEEVGELLESQVLACLHPNVEHLILIGDEKQLRPKIQNYNLEKNYNFNISLFERLIINDFPKMTLLTQLRMRPEISELMGYYYKGLIDHERVKSYPDVPGIQKNVIFFTHENNETIASKTKSNLFEAQICSKLALYLSLQNDYSVNDITIITPYIGQGFFYFFYFFKKST
jgi:superfamily I DNA and/or RNA helicase